MALLDVDEATERFKKKLDEGYFDDKGLSNEEILTMMKALMGADKEQGMTKEQKDKILKALAEDRNYYVRDCQRRIEKEWGKIEGADYMLQRFLDVLNTEIEPQESEV